MSFERGEKKNPQKPSGKPKEIPLAQEGWGRGEKIKCGNQGRRSDDGDLEIQKSRRGEKNTSKRKLLLTCCYNGKEKKEKGREEYKNGKRS